MNPGDTVVAAITARLGSKYVKTGADTDGYLHDFWDRAQGKTLCVALPGSTAEVSSVLALCNEDQVAVFPQGGNTAPAWVPSRMAAATP